MSVILLAPMNPQTQENFQNPIVRRAAFEMGSGSIKLLVADINHRKRSIEKNIYERRVNLNFVNAISETKEFGTKISDVALKKLLNLKRDAIAHGASEFYGVATAIFRNTSNGPSFIAELSDRATIPLQVISQEEEGKLGFLTAECSYSEKISPDQILAWDSGNGSFQITAKNNDEFYVFNGPIGNTKVWKDFIEKIRKQEFDPKVSPNPISSEEIEAFISYLIDQLPDSPKWLTQKVSSPDFKVIGIGDSSSIFSLAAKATGKSTFTKQDVEEAIYKHIGLTDQDLAHYDSLAKIALIRLMFAYSVMAKVGIKEVTYCETMGSIPAILTNSDYWA